jgi:hypothetical protein
LCDRNLVPKIWTGAVDDDVSTVHDGDQLFGSTGINTERLEAGWRAVQRCKKFFRLLRVSRTDQDFIEVSIVKEIANNLPTHFATAQHESVHRP